MPTDAILSIDKLGFPWKTKDPFLFCAYHADNYPKGNANLGPEDDLTGRTLGSDFELKDGYRMYHGKKVPGFPAHPHRGFETVTIVEKGLVDHSDSLGAAGRFGNGDVQWMTAGKGVQHSEMFPLLNKKEKNPFELFQIWLNLPKLAKFVAPYFDMRWKEDIPIVAFEDNSGNKSEIKIIVGNLEQTVYKASAPDSWASNPKSEMNIWLIKLEENGTLSLPKSSSSVNKTLYFYEGESILLNGKSIGVQNSIEVKPDENLELVGDKGTNSLLLLEGVPLNEPVAQYGPFVMNTQQEIQEAMMDFQQSQFGGWPWPAQDHVHGPEKGRFALHANGKLEEK